MDKSSEKAIIWHTLCWTTKHYHSLWYKHFFQTNEHFSVSYTTVSISSFIIYICKHYWLHLLITCKLHAVGIWNEQLNQIKVCITRWLHISTTKIWRKICKTSINLTGLITVSATEASLLLDPEYGMPYLQNSYTTSALDSLGTNWSRIYLSRALNHGALWHIVFLRLRNIITYLLTYLTETETESETCTYMTVSSSTSISQPKAAQEIVYNSNQRNILSHSWMITAYQLHRNTIKTQTAQNYIHTNYNFTKFLSWRLYWPTHKFRNGIITIIIYTFLLCHKVIISDNIVH